MKTARLITLVFLQVFLFIACGGGSGSTGGGIWTPAPAGPTIQNFQASPTRIAKGDSATLVCAFVGTKGTISPAGTNLSASGSFSVAPTETTTYTLEVTGANGQVQVQSLTLEVFISAALPVGPMLQARYRHTATVLKTGLVLVTGGLDKDDKALATAEIFDPATGQFRATGTMASARFGHTATLMDDGKVLVVGQDRTHYGEVGLLGHGPASEVFDPATETFTPTATDPIGIRFEHTATKMKDGRVFITKGVKDLGSPLHMSFTYEWLTFSEIYWPSTGRWIRVGADTQRVSSLGNAAVLPNGMIFHCGGMGTYGPMDTAEVYDPVTNVSTVLPVRLNEPRATDAMAVLPDGRLILAGGRGRTGALSSTDIFDPSTMTFTRGPGLPLAWSAPVAALLENGTVLFLQAHGVDASNTPRPNAVVWSQASGVSEWGSTREDREQACSVRLLNGVTLILGGKRGGKALASAEEIDK